MKKIFFTVCALFALTVASAQTTRDDGDNIDEKLQQQAPRETQRQVENAARANTPQAQHNQDMKAAEEKIRKEKERSTGKDSKNPAENTQGLPPSKQIEPASTPVKNK